MPNFIIKHNDALKGTANYADEARDFAERMSGRQPGSNWSSDGQLYVRSQPTGWTIRKRIASPVEVR